ncbi:MAG: hypothetical protein QOK05_889 [Chloroflexota bacterium]|jgi:hypothetical protein|nr:hypothetical protein [Chloroflexota bacterium]
MFRAIGAAAMAAAAVLAQVVPAAACGGLISPNGSIRLTRASTLVDWHDGVEHYLTSFSYAGGGFSDFGFIVPLPAAPDKVEEGGGWTLQRLNREVNPPRLEAFGAAANAAAAPTAEVLQTVQVKALDITVLKGTGSSIVEWCAKNHYLLNAETRAHLEVYGKGSPFFMAAKYNVARAEASGQLVGDGAPVLITMHTPHLWVPLEILANGVSQVNADVFLMTDSAVYASDLAALDGESPTGGLVAHAAGMTVPYQKTVSDQLFRDLSSDKNMGWVRKGTTLTYLRLDAPAATVGYDLGLSTSGVIHLAAYGTAPARVPDGHHDLGGASAVASEPTSAPIPSGVGTLVAQLVGIAALLAAVVLLSRRRGPSATA